MTGGYEYEEHMRQRALKQDLEDECSKSAAMGESSRFAGGKRTDIKPVVWPKTPSRRNRGPKKPHGFVAGPPIEIDAKAMASAILSFATRT
jgi:hypothetical protein